MGETEEAARRGYAVGFAAGVLRALAATGGDGGRLCATAAEGLERAAFPRDEDDEATTLTPPHGTQAGGEDTGEYTGEPAESASTEPPRAYPAVPYDEPAGVHGDTAEAWASLLPDPAAVPVESPGRAEQW